VKLHTVFNNLADLPIGIDLSGMASRITVLISGTGTNLKALIDATQSNQPSIPNAQIVRVISNRKGALGLVKASEAGIPTTYHNLVPYKTQFSSSSNPDADAEARQAYDSKLAELVLADKPDIVVCAGFMHILSTSFLDPLQKANVPVINLHPALPGQFNGAGAIERAMKAYEQGEITKTGVMVHYVIAEVDMGEPVVVEEIPFEEGDDIKKLESRIRAVEWKIIVDATKVVLDKIRVQKHKQAIPAGIA